MRNGGHSGFLSRQTTLHQTVQGISVNIVGVDVLYTPDVNCCFLSAGSMKHEAFAVD
jgi:hypothetical protein